MDASTSSIMRISSRRRNQQESVPQGCLSARGARPESFRLIPLLAIENGYLEKPVYEKLRNASMELSAWLSNQIKALKVVVK
jgi:hypothetical protein